MLYMVIQQQLLINTYAKIYLRTKKTPHLYGFSIERYLEIKVLNVYNSSSFEMGLELLFTVLLHC